MALAVARNSNTNQRVDTPSPDDVPLLTGTDFAYTQQTPLGGLTDAREYADGALATQKLLAAPIIPIDRQMWVGVDTRMAYFGNNFGGEKIAKVPELLQSGMRRLVIDLWWDGAGLGWQMCPRLKRDGGQLSTIMMALDREHKDLEAALQIQGMGKNQAVAQEETHSEPMDQPRPQPELSQPSSSSSSTISFTPSFPRESPAASKHKRNSRYTNSNEDQQMGSSYGRARDKYPRSPHTAHDNGFSTGRRASDKKDHVVGASQRGLRRQQNRTGHEWFRRKRTPRRPPVKTIGLGANQARRNKDVTRSASESLLGDRAQLNPSYERYGRLHQLGVSSIVSSYDKSTATDKTVDGITCSTGDDVVMLLQGLGTWMEQTSENELEDVLLIILNLNELGNNSLGSRPLPQQPPTSSSSPMPLTSGINATAYSAATSSKGNEDSFRSFVSLNTNKAVKALLPNIISLKELFTEAFPFLIYNPTLLEMDRADLQASWWNSGPVGLDYYNTTTNPATGRIQAPTGWPTSSYLTEVIKRRIIIGIGANRLSANTTYNVTDDFTTLYAPEVLGPTMTNSSLLRISPALNLDHCNFLTPEVAMVPTGTEASTSLDDSSRNNSESVMDVTWSFVSMSDSDLSPWSYASGQLASTCGFSSLLESRAPTLSFSEHTAMTVWSWDLDQPPLNQTRSRDRRCGAMQSNGRWAVQDCNMKLPVACRQVNTSSKWFIYEKGAANYRDVICPEGYKFDVPRTARENQLLYKTLLSYWNVTAPLFYASLMDHQRHASHELLDKGDVASMLQKRRHSSNDSDENEDEVRGEEDDKDNNDSDNEGSGEQQQGRSSFSLSSTSPSFKEHGGRTASRSGDNGWMEMTTKDATESTPPLKAIPNVPGGGMIWIDISSWQTAGCWVPGGVHGICPYQEPDNTVALQEIIKVSTIGGVIILALVGMFLYLKCRRNVRLRKANKRRGIVRNKLMRTEVETVPA
ncbi:hypothetical protein BGZ65_011151 [Modicella reniformis]|uniref:C-type lectin domain-containing protein n=1 Tax=Modicella reniformis TaxID=1440133 RepID=A0A9P6M1N6_9FUNG|nr:hypothetical protein BGZ65_011151 [Modicella reniformis]